MISILVSNQLMPTRMRWCSSRRKTRIAHPMWLRCARPARTCARSTPQYCFNPRCYVSIVQTCPVTASRVAASILRSLVAQYSVWSSAN